jgi:hypothetical protein
MVVIQNKNIGHSLIPEVRDLYEAWVEFTVKGSDGKEIYHSGFLKPDGSLDERAHSFTNRPVNVAGDFVDNHKVWTIHSVAYDNTIPAGRSVLVRYEFRIPAECQRSTDRHRARQLSASAAELSEQRFRKRTIPPIPVVELSSRSRTFESGRQPGDARRPARQSEWMRWNNFGIACLDQLQYADAINAF